MPYPAILDKKGPLTPIEYDIVKKHTVFGSELIEKSGDALDPAIKAYARDVCRYHHERFDGTGYPDGLKGDDIPIWAQIVSIADAYEAITSERSYKSALSRDVALEMITNGMCGVFNPLLLQCLIHVADRKELEDIRSNLITSRAVHIAPYSLPPKKVLLLGNMRYITQKFIEDSFPDAHISIIGKCTVKPSRSVKIYDIDKPYYRAILDTNDFDFIIYFANELTYDTLDPSDTEELRQILDRVECQERMGVCLDTCHVWDGGYDIVGDLDGVLEEFDRVVGLSRLRAVHINDSKNPCGAHKDRHEKIGQGFIGVEAFERIVNHPALRELPFILETPNELPGYAEEIALLRSLAE